MKKSYRIAPDLRAQIMSRVKNDGIPVAQAAKDHGVSEATIYTWLGKKAEGGSTVLEIAKLRRENSMLKELVGEITLKLSETQKKKRLGEVQHQRRYLQQRCLDSHLKRTNPCLNSCVSNLNNTRVICIRILINKIELV